MPAHCRATWEYAPNNDEYQMGDAVLNSIMSSGLYAGVLKI
jgi:hypothetical protein